MRPAGDQVMRILGFVAVSVALGGCTSGSQDITPAYVSPAQYQGFTCQQLALEAQSIVAKANILSGGQDSQRAKDTWATGATIVIVWPASFFVGGDKQASGEFAQMKGQMIAVEQASATKKCGIRFEHKPSPE
jgi:hypothetical protein